MTKPESHATVRIVLHEGEPYIESVLRLRAIDADAEDGPIPKGKILVLRTPLLTPGSGEDDTESELIDDDGSDEAFCPECAAAGHDPNDLSILGAADESRRRLRSAAELGRAVETILVRAAAAGSTSAASAVSSIEAPPETYDTLEYTRSYPLWRTRRLRSRSRKTSLQRSTRQHVNGANHGAERCFISRILRTALRARRDAGITRRLNELCADERVVIEQERITRAADSTGTDWSEEGWE